MALALFDLPGLHRRGATLSAPTGVAVPVWPVKPPGGRIRVGYLSSDLHEHATARLLAGVLEAHDRSRFEIYAVSYGPETGGAMQERLRAALRNVDRVITENETAVKDTLLGLESFTAGLANNRARVSLDGSISAEETALPGNVTTLEASLTAPRASAITPLAR